MARAYQSLKIKERRKKNRKTKGTMTRTRRIRVSKKTSGGKIVIKRQYYNGKPSKAPDFSKWHD